MATETLTRSRTLTNPPIPQSLQHRLFRVFNPLSFLVKPTSKISQSQQFLQPSNHQSSPAPPPPSSSSTSSRRSRTASISLSSITIDDFLAIYSLESLSSRLRRMGFQEMDSLRRANPHHLRRPGGFAAPSRSSRGGTPSSPTIKLAPSSFPTASSPTRPRTLSRTSSTLEGLTDQEVTELFVALRMWDEDMGPDGGDVRGFMAARVERAEMQVFRKVGGSKRV